MDSPLTIVTYNLWGYGSPAELLKRRGVLRGADPGSKAAHHGPAESVWGKRRACLVRALGAADPDLVAVQENARRPGDPDRSHARRLARSFGMEAVEGTFYPVTDAEGRPFETGLALLTHCPVEARDELPLPFESPVPLGGIPAVLRVTLDFDDIPLHVWVTHLPGHDRDLQAQCARRIREAAGRIPLSEPLLLCGDLNADPETPAPRLLQAGPSPGAVGAARLRLLPGRAAGLARPRRGDPRRRAGRRGLLRVEPPRSARAIPDERG
jgi:endonuclease/exonuclease/phosphatase family metal-dependent hydrolase